MEITRQHAFSYLDSPKSIERLTTSQENQRSDILCNENKSLSNRLTSIEINSQVSQQIRHISRVRMKRNAWERLPWGGFWTGKIEEEILQFWAKVPAATSVNCNSLPLSACWDVITLDLACERRKSRTSCTIRMRNGIAAKCRENEWAPWHNRVEILLG